MIKTAKTKQIYICQNCGTEHLKWVGKCSSCKGWNTIEEKSITKKKSRGIKQNTITPLSLDKIHSSKEIRIDTRDNELNRVLGGGLVLGSLVLIGGEPGIGKSTLALQIALKLENHKVLYVSGEESTQQIKLRANRIGIRNNNCLILSDTSLENITAQIELFQPNIVIIDSIQTINIYEVESPVGSISQIKECTNVLLKIAKEQDIPILLIGHINKEGSLAGPKVLEHIVDTVLYFEGNTHHLYRILRAAKNRFGSTNEIGIYEMNNQGLKEVINPSELLLSHKSETLSGITISASIEGIRPFLIEVQALVSTAVYGTPQRSSTGFDSKRLNMLLAVLEKKAGFKLATKDVFLNIAGGIKVNDTAIDLAVITAILSSNLDIPIRTNYCFTGEVGLSGEIRPVTRIESRIREAEKLGFEKIFISKANSLKDNSSNFKIEIVEVEKVENVFKVCFRQ